MSKTRFLSAIIGLAIMAAGVTGVAASVVRSDPFGTDILVASPRMDAEAVAELARKRLDGMASVAPTKVPVDIIDVTAVEASALNTIEPDAEVEVASTLSPDRIIWLVRANASFISYRGPGRGPLFGRTGYVLVDDATGLPAGMGFRIESYGSEQ